MNTINDLIALLTLQKISENHFVGQNYASPWGRVFGGQVLGQSLYAAYQTVPQERLSHSMHGYFILAGDIDIPIDYKVDTIRDGKSFTTRRVVAYQNEKAIFNMAASFQKREEGVDHQITMPNVLTPDLLLTDLQQAKPLQKEDPERYASLKAAHPKMVEFRPVEQATFLQAQNKPPKSHVWMRIQGPTPESIPLKQQLLAFISDYSLLITATLPHRKELIKAKTFFASLDHAIWFHRHFSVGDWFLYEIESPSASNARGFSRGNIFDKKGMLLASVTQEGLIRKNF